VEGLKALRYLFTRFYFWCIVPYAQDQMEGCPADEGLNMLYLVLTGLVGVFLFLVTMGIVTFFRNQKKAEKSERLAELQKDAAFVELQEEMYGDKQLRRLIHEGSRSTLYSSLYGFDSDEDSSSSLGPHDAPLDKTRKSDSDDSRILVEYDC
jgi:hypothetical protein